MTFDDSAHKKAVKVIVESEKIMNKTAKTLVILLIISLASLAYAENTPGTTDDKDLFYIGMSKWFGSEPKENYKKSIIYSIKNEYDENDPIIDFHIDKFGRSYFLHDSGIVKAYNNTGETYKTIKFNKNVNENFGLKIDNDGNILYYSNLGLTALQLYDNNLGKIVQINRKLSGEPNIYNGNIYIKKNGKSIYDNPNKSKEIKGAFVNNFKKEINIKNNTVILNISEIKK